MKVSINRFKKESQHLLLEFAALKNIKREVSENERKEFYKAYNAIRNTVRIIQFIEDPATTKYSEIYNNLRPAFGKKIITEEKMKKLRKKYGNRMTL